MAALAIARRQYACIHQLSVESCVLAERYLDVGVIKFNRFGRIRNSIPISFKFDVGLPKVSETFASVSNLDLLEHDCSKKKDPHHISLSLAYSSPQRLASHAVQMPGCL